MNFYKNSNNCRYGSKHRTTTFDTVLESWDFILFNEKILGTIRYPKCTVNSPPRTIDISFNHQNPTMVLSPLSISVCFLSWCCLQIPKPYDGSLTPYISMVLWEGVYCELLCKLLFKYEVNRTKTGESIKCKLLPTSLKLEFIVGHLLRDNWLRRNYWNNIDNRIFSDNKDVRNDRRIW